MAITFPPQLNFARGEITERLHARYDLDHYKIALKEALNFAVLRHGGATRRSGTLYVNTIRAPNDDYRFLEFIYDETQAYCIEMGYDAAGATGGKPASYCRFHARGGTVEVGGNPYEVNHGYTQAQVRELDWQASFDTVYLAHGDRAPQKLVRRAETDWVLQPYEYIDGPYEPLNTTPTTFKTSAAVGNVTVDASATEGINNGQGFLPTDLGRWVRILLGTWWGAGKIIAVNNTKQIVMKVDNERQFKGVGTVTTWRLGSWTMSPGADGNPLGFPRKIGFLGERLAFANSPGHPSSIWLSEAGVLTSYRVGPTYLDGTATRPAAATDALQFDISGVNQILWLEESDDLVYGTTQNARALGASRPGVAISSTDVAHRKGQAGGMSTVRPVLVNNALLAVNFFKKAVREVSYNADKEKYVAPEVTVLSEHLLRAGVEQLASCPEPEACVYMRTTDGELVSMTYEPEQQMVALTPFKIAPSSLDNQDYAEVNEIAGVPGDGVYNLWLGVKRTIDGVTRRYVEMMQPLFEGDTAADGFFVDSGLTATEPAENEPATVWAGWDHLKGQRVAIMTDKGVHPPVIVAADGTITLTQWACHRVTAGLGYPARLQTLPIVQANDGSLTGRKRRLARVIIDFLRSGPCDVRQPDGTKKERYIQRKAADAMDAPVPLFTGALNRAIEGGWDKQGQIVIEIGASEPTPVTIRAIVPGFDSEP